MPLFRDKKFLAEASLTCGSTFLNEIIQAAGLPENEVKQVLERFQREGYYA